MFPALIFLTRNCSFQFKCGKCDRRFNGREKMMKHTSKCTKCPKCGVFVETPHLARCKGLKIQTIPRIMCRICNRPRLLKSMRYDMAALHGEKDWKRRDGVVKLSRPVSCRCPSSNSYLLSQY